MDNMPNNLNIIIPLFRLNFYVALILNVCACSTNEAYTFFAFPMGDPIQNFVCTLSVLCCVHIEYIGM